MLLKVDKLLYTTKRKEYFEYELSSKRTNILTIQEYCERIFGQYNYKLRTILSYSFEIGKNQIFATHYQINDLFIFDLNGELIENKKGFFDYFTPYEIALSNENEIWAATGACQVVFCKEIVSQKTKYIIGKPYNDESDLSFPENVVIYKKKLFISEMGNRQVLTIDLDKYSEKFIYRKFDEPVWGFLKNEFAEIVILDSGVYQINDETLIKLPIQK